MEFEVKLSLTKSERVWRFWKYVTDGVTERGRERERAVSTRGSVKCFEVKHQLVQGRVVCVCVCVCVVLCVCVLEVRDRQMAH